MIKRVLQHTFSLLNVDHVNLTSKWNYQNVISPYFRIYFINEGSGEIWDQSKTLLLEPGYLYIIPSFTLCNLGCSDHLTQYFVQFFEESADGVSLFAHYRTIQKIQATPMEINLFSRLLEINPGRGINRSDDPKVYEKNIFYKEYQELNNQQNISSYLETQGILLQLVSRFLHSQFHQQRKIDLSTVKMVETVSYILVHLKEELSVSLLASLANQNVDYFSRAFKSYTGERPAKYIIEKRIERAQHLLATSRMSYSEIAFQTGFDSLSYFSKTFKKLVGMSPRAYKRQVYMVGFTM
jgi:AraC-like DNA-binding protein